jgi:hypothetical protein
MYHPYFRGKQYELITVKEMAPFLAECDFRPINEPVRSEFGGLQRALDAVRLSAVIDYTPSQYLCEFIKRCGYDGVIYRSSVSDGMNLALFNPAKAAPGEAVQYRVSRVSVVIEQFVAEHGNEALPPD